MFAGDQLGFFFSANKTSFNLPLAKTGVQGTVVQASIWVFAVLGALRLAPLRADILDIRFLLPMAAIFNWSAFGQWQQNSKQLPW